MTMRTASVFVSALFALFAGPGAAQTTTPGAEAPAAPDGAITIELNKLEPAQNACRAYFVVNNDTPTALKELRISVFFFDKSGVILRQLGLPFPDIRANRTKVALFDIGDLGCGDVGRLLVNEVLACTDATGAPVEGCADRVQVTTRAEATFEY
jgi:hypothetical protein